MHTLEREVAPDEAHAAPPVLEHELHRRRRLPAVRAFEVSVLDDRHRRVLAAEEVVGGGDRNRELEGTAHQVFTPSSATTRCTAGRLSMRSLSAV